jgi:proline iminopeptidase
MTSSTPRFIAVLLCVAASLSLGCITAEEPGTLVPPTADQDPALPQRTITVAGKARAIHTETFGDPSRPALFLLHDSLVDYRAFQPFEALSDRYFVVMWDQRGHGLSERISDEAEYTPASIVEEIDALKAIHSPDAPVTLIGHGFGAAYAALYMSRKPASVSQAVLMEPFGLNGQIFWDTYDVVFDDSTWTTYVSEMLWQTEVITATDHETVDYRALTWAADGGMEKPTCAPATSPSFPIWRPGGYMEVLREKMLEVDDETEPKFDFAAGLSTFPAMVRILVSDCSVLDFTYQNTNNRPLFQHSEIVVVRGAGHRMFVDQPTATLAAVKEYLVEY